MQAHSEAVAAEPAVALPPGAVDRPGNIPEAAIEVGGQYFMVDAEGAHVPLKIMKPMDLLIDEEVRKIIRFARELSAMISRFKAHTFVDVEGLQGLIFQEYGVKRGGAKGNVTFHSFDGTLRVTQQIADRLEFGAELQAAKALIDECMVEWSEGAREELRAIVNRAFNVDKEGQIDRTALFMLMRIESTDERWLRAMKAVKDSIRVIGSRSYVRFHERDGYDGEWKAIPIDLARA